MDIQTLKETNVKNKILAGAGIMIVIVSIIGFREQIASEGSIPSHLTDSRVISALNDLSSLVPDGSVLVVSAYGSIVTYYTGHITATPHSGVTEDSLVNYMVKKGYEYLVVFEGKSAENNLRTLFSSKGLKSLDDRFQQLASYSTDFSTIHLYELEDQNLRGNVWQTYIITQDDVSDFGHPDISAVNAIKIRIADGGTGRVSVWLGSLSLIDAHDNETVITDFQNRQGFKKVRGSGTQSYDTSDFATGKQSLKLETDGNGMAVVTRKPDISHDIDFTGKNMKMWIKINDVSMLSEFRVIVSSDGFESYRNYWIQLPPR